jgi:hypothetical protein
MKTALSIAALFVAVGAVSATAHANPRHGHGGWKHGGWAPAPVARPVAAQDAMLHRRLLADADGYQPGTVQWVGGGRLALRPFEHRAGVANVTYRPDAPVYFGYGMTSLDRVAPGTELTIYFRRTPWGGTRVVAAVVLDELAAARLRRECNAAAPVYATQPAYPTAPAVNVVVPVRQPASTTVVIGAPPPAYPRNW